MIRREKVIEAAEQCSDVFERLELTPEEIYEVQKAGYEAAKLWRLFNKLPTKAQKGERA